MSRKDKLLLRLQQRPKDFTWDELSVLLKSLGYKQAKSGKTGGSRRRFIHPVAEYDQFEVRRREYKEAIGEAESIKQLEQAAKKLPSKTKGGRKSN
jgi:hypothetical protein